MLMLRRQLLAVITCASPPTPPAVAREAVPPPRATADRLCNLAGVASSALGINNEGFARSSAAVGAAPAIDDGSEESLAQAADEAKTNLHIENHTPPVPSVRALADNNLDCSAWADADRSRAWLVFSQQRSGSTWTVQTVQDRSGHLAVSGGEITRNQGNGIAACYPSAAEFDDSATTACKCALVSRFKALMADSKSDDGRSFGFKLMLPWDDISSASNNSKAYGPLAQAVCELGIPFVFIWRRNVLRQLLSNKAMNTNAMAHAHTESQLHQILSAQITLDTKVLRHQIAGVLNNHLNLERAFTGCRDCPTAQRARRYYYEDIVDSAPYSDRLWGSILNTLGLWHKSTMLVLHADKSLNDSIANADEVFRALQGTSYAWMLTSDAPASPQ